MSDQQPPAARRPLTTRNAGWARALAAALARMRVRPDAISVASVVYAMAAGAALLLLPSAAGWQVPALLVASAAGIQLRLLCNMLDGMVAVEGGLRSPVGPLYNEVPDRIADTVILVAAGYALPQLPWSVELGWAAAALAMLTAYIRALGGELGAPGCFHGPMAKPHRMATLTVAVLAAACTSTWPWWPWILWSALAAIVLGAAITSLRRLLAIAAVLRSR
jgi:phosphatidylglycerophosphate synthase